MTLNISDNKHIYLTVSGILVGVAVIAIAVFGFREGIDFTGGSLWQFQTGNSSVSSDQVEAYMKTLPGIADVKLTSDAKTGALLARLPNLEEKDHQALLASMKDKFPGFTEFSFQSIGPSVSAALKQSAMIAIVLVLVGISLYIAYAFRKVSRPISSWKYGWITLLTLFHDVAIPAGMLAFLGHFLQVEIDTNFIVALLVVMGFSVHDTIVVFDRIRENLFHEKGKLSFPMTINKSVNQTLARSINTSLTLILVLVALYVTGPANLHYFVLTLLVGVVTGIYSSVFVASPALLLLHREKNS
jgi:preprotein translocase subunit SecF